MDQAYKTLKEAALTNFTGSTVWETYLLSFLMPLTVFFHYIFIRDKQKTLLHVLKEYMCWCLPYILTFAFLTDHLPITTLVTLLFLLIYVFLNPTAFPCLNEAKLAEFNSKRKPFLTTYRVAVMIGVSITILMVDFPNIYPQKLGKCKDFGISVMDSGVGTFVFSSALTAQVSDRSISSIIKSLLPTVLIGVVRSISIHMTNYQQIVTEYGVHWNFFFTIACVSLLVNLMGQTQYNFSLGFFFAILHQSMLYFGMQDYVLGPLRDNFVAQNKEGICTLLGYVSIYYFACGFGVLLKTHRSKQEWKNFMRNSWIVSVGLFLLTQIFLNYLSISRRLVNIGYIVATMGLNSVIFNSMMMISMYTSVHEAFYVEIVNSNPLYFFLVANLLTGLVNFTVNTLQSSVLTSVLIVCGYALLVTILRWKTMKLM